jgi:hypothetical protein
MELDGFSASLLDKQPQFTHVCSAWDVVTFFGQWLDQQRFELTPEEITSLVEIVCADPEYWGNSTMMRLYDNVHGMHN